MNKKILTNEKLEELYSKANESYIELLRWLYENHYEILREYEKTKGKLRIAFLGEK
jgi:hypothetical protein